MLTLWLTWAVMAALWGLLTWLLGDDPRTITTKADEKRTVVELRDPARLSQSLVIWLDGAAETLPPLVLPDPDPEQPQVQPSFSPDGKRVVVARIASSVFVWDLEEGVEQWFSALGALPRVERLRVVKPGTATPHPTPTATRTTRCRPGSATRTRPRPCPRGA